MPPPEIVTVVLGAGASYAVADGRSPVDEKFRPPLTRGLFNLNERPWLLELTHSLPGVIRLQSDLARAAESDERGLERLLQDLAQHPVRERRRWFRDVPPFLQAQIHRASRQYLKLQAHCLPGTPGGGNYQKLVDDLFHTGTDRWVVFITLNYDDYLEQALAIGNEAVTSMRDYAHPGRAWRMVKLHGSINWFVDLSSAWDPTDADFPKNWREALVAMESRDYDRSIGVHPGVTDVWRQGPPFRSPPRQ